MLFLTHILFALFIGIVYNDFIPINNQILFLIFVLLGSIIPDIDNPKSKIGKKLPIISHIIKLILGHRGIFHSVWPLILLLSITITINKTLAIGLSIGYFSHLLLDSLTISGVRLFYPFKLRISGIIKTGSLFEKILLLFLTIITLIIILLNIS